MEYTFSPVSMKPKTISIRPRQAPLCICGQGRIPVGVSVCNATITYNTSTPYLNAPTGLYFVCGSKAYTWLPPGWSGTCYIAFLLPPTFNKPPTYHRQRRDTVDQTDTSAQLVKEECYVYHMDRPIAIRSKRDGPKVEPVTWKLVKVRGGTGAVCKCCLCVGALVAHGKKLPTLAYADRERQFGSLASLKSQKRARRREGRASKPCSERKRKGRQIAALGRAAGYFAAVR
ncbi:hypothetical protein NDU88_001183 [Pleurodeles waltl]|uniref:Uncharacterized protein n=1 Tax=Pleurodeles waltl TaxID=8319 RepID=A0AAV7S893_PLEWA|nr:hypothetical protein NDU88_001183 [Pleurodeles waltl]